MTSLWSISDQILASKLNKSFNTGLDANKGTPTAIGEAYLATDTKKIYFSTDGSTWDMILYDDDAVYIDSSGNVGIGTTNPQGKLHISWPDANYIFTSDSTSGYTSTFMMDDIGLKIGHGSVIRDIEFQTSSLTRMTISQGGNVGIGLTNPAGLLDVNSKFVVGASSITGTLVNAANGLISFDSNRDIPHLRPKAASANLRHSHDSLSSAVSTSTYELLKTMTFTYGIRGTLRIAFRLVGSGGGTSYARVYKNGSPIGTVQTQNGSTSSTKTEDINVGSLSSGGTLEVWGSSDEFGGQTTAVQEFRIYYDNAADTVLVGGVTTS